MEEIISMWNEMGLLNQVLANKLLFVETPDVAETTLALGRIVKTLSPTTDCLHNNDQKITRNHVTVAEELFYSQLQEES